MSWAPSMDPQVFLRDLKFGLFFLVVSRDSEFEAHTSGPSYPLRTNRDHKAIEAPPH